MKFIELLAIDVKTLKIRIGVAKERYPDKSQENC